MRHFIFSILLFCMNALFATHYEVGTLAELEQKANGARAGDTISLAAGDYSGSIKLDKTYTGEVVFAFNGVKLDGSGFRFGIDLKGKQITLILNSSEISGGNEAGIAQRGDFIKVLAKNTTVKDNNAGLLLLGTNHLVSGLTFDGQKTIGISGNNLKLDPITRNTRQGFNWGGRNNWRITGCSFFNIRPPSPGNAGGAIRLIPHVLGVIVDNCHFENIEGNALWFDHYDDDLYLAFNTFRNIEFKCIFLEIGDPNPKNPIIGVKVVGNVSRGNSRHGAFISACSDVEVFGNDFEGWPVVAAGMQRDFYRRIDPKNQSSWIRVDAELKRNSIHHNVLRATAGRNHIMMFTGSRSGENVIDNNYYVTGNTSSYKSTPIHDAHFSLNDGKFLHNIDKVGVGGIDNNGIVGAAPISFPFPEVYQGLPIQKGARTDMGTPDPDTTSADPPAQPSSKPNIWTISDLSDERTDKDDRVSSSMLLTSLDHFNLKGWTVGAHKWNLSKSLDWFNQNLSRAYALERDNLNNAYGGFPEVLPMHLASTTGKGYRPGLTSLDQYPSVKALYEAAREGKLYILLWGPGGEVATMLDYASRQTDQSAFLNTIVISHASAPSSLNNCARDKAACEYLHELAKSGKLKLYELGFAGKVIDDKTFPKIGREVLQSEIGKYLEEKWQAEKPDGSDAITFFILIPQLGGGEDYLLTLKSDGTSNMIQIMGGFSKQNIYDYLIIRYNAAANGRTGHVPVPNPDPIVNPKGPTNTEIKTFLVNLSTLILDFSKKL